jgi:hypothetical protein
MVGLVPAIHDHRLQGLIAAVVLAFPPLPVCMDRPDEPGDDDQEG